MRGPEHKILVVLSLLSQSCAAGTSGDSYLEVKTFFPFYKVGYDRDGLAVYVAEFGKWDFATMAEKSEKFQQEFWKYGEEQFQRIDLDASEHSSQGVALIVDYDGFGLRSFRSARALQFVLKLFNRVVHFNNSLKYGFIINLDFMAESFVNAGRPLYGDILDKFESFGTRESRWKPVLLRKIPPSQLPTKYGGSEEWRPPFEREIN